MSPRARPHTRGPSRLSSSLILVLLLALAVAPAAGAAWPMEGGDAQRTSRTTIGLPTSDVRLAWNGSGQFTGVIVAPDGSVVATGDNITVFERDGRVRWSMRQEGPQVTFRGRGVAGLLSDGTIVVPGARELGQAGIRGYDIRDGSLRFDNQEIRGRCDSPTDGAVAVAPDDSFYIAQCGLGLTAFHKNGTVKWMHSVNAERVALHGTSVYLVADHYTPPNTGEYDDLVLALSQENGRFLWAALLSTVRTDVLVDDDHVYVADGQAVVALDASNGTKVWSRVVPQPLALALTPNGTVAAASSLIMSYLSPDDGSLFAETATRDGPHLVAGTGMHLRGRDNTLWGVDSAGTTLWEVQGAGNFQSNVAIGNNGEIYVAEGGRLDAFTGGGRIDTPSPTPGATPPTGTPTVDTETPPRGTTPTAGSVTSPGATPTSGNAAETEGGGAPGPGLVAILLAAAGAALVLGRHRR